jgi:hypothetical protein
VSNERNSSEKQRSTERILNSAINCGYASDLIRTVDILKCRIEKERLSRVMRLNQPDGGVVELKGAVRTVATVGRLVILPKVDQLAGAFGMGTEKPMSGAGRPGRPSLCVAYLRSLSDAYDLRRLRQGCKSQSMRRALLSRSRGK